ncbi:hypothetical protein K438DRAFT_1969567 [Mycena galopus ATCC 62051]|nr:hypothetical protein K438DRAFT_1969567 [Mycena galopus ATCC 62051]
MVLPVWPTSLHTRRAVVDFLRDRETPALATDIYNVDFYPGKYGSYAVDETACTTDGERTPYYTYLVGCVAGPVFFDDANLRLRIEPGGPEDAELNALFQRQIAQLALIVRDGDDEDLETGNEVALLNWSDTDRYTLVGGTFIELMLGFPPVYDVVDGTMQVSEPVKAGDYTLQKGDWVLALAVLQRSDDRSGYDVRRYSVAPQKIRILRFEPAELISDQSVPTAPIAIATASEQEAMESADDDTLSGASGETSIAPASVRKPRFVSFLYVRSLLDGLKIEEAQVDTVTAASILYRAERGETQAHTSHVV